MPGNEISHISNAQLKLYLKTKLTVDKKTYKSVADPGIDLRGVDFVNGGGGG